MKDQLNLESLKLHLFNLVNDKEHVAQQLAWRWCDVSMALAFISVFVSLLWRFLLLGFALLQQAWCRAVSSAPGSVVIAVIYACVVTCGRSFTMLSGWGILISFWSVLVFSPTHLSLLPLLPYYHCHYCCYYYWLSLLLLFPQSFWLCVTGAWAGAGYGGWGSWLGCGQGRLLGVLLLPGFGVSSSSPQVPGHPSSICNTVQY